jgi:predicted regulator of Ras-like GTPase activity (Roadblock/LC7/MglB family)
VTGPRSAAQATAALGAAVGEPLGLEGFRSLEVLPAPAPAPTVGGAALTADAAGRALPPLRDLRGVIGSFVVTEVGRPVARDLPALFDVTVLAEVGPRALRLAELAARAEGPGPRWCTLHYAGHVLLLRPLQGGLLCLLADSTVNLAAARMGMNLAARALGGGGPDQNRM